MTKRKKAKTKGKPKAAAAKVVAEVAEEEASAELAPRGADDEGASGSVDRASEDVTDGDLEDPTLASLGLSVAMEAAAQAVAENEGDPLGDANDAPAGDASSDAPSDEGEASSDAPSDEAGAPNDVEATAPSAPPASASDTGIPSDLELFLGEDSRRDAAQEEREDEAGATDAVEVERKHLRGLVEALVFASDSPMPSRDIARHASAPVKRVREILGELRREYQSRGIHLEEVAGGWAFRTSVQYAPFVRDLTKQKPVKLTRAQVEALAIIAYRQPITRPEIDEVRGVDSGPVLKVLLERDLVRILGKRDEPGRPLIYGTAPKFLEFFGLRSLKDLPTLREFTELTDESRQAYEDELGESPTEHVADFDEEPGEGDAVADEGHGEEIEEPIAPREDVDAAASARGLEETDDEASPAVPDDVPSNIDGELADIIGASDPDSERGEEIEEPIDPGEDVDEAALEELADDDEGFGESDLEELGRQALEELELDPSADMVPEPAASSASTLDASDEDLS